MGHAVETLDHFFTSSIFALRFLAGEGEKEGRLPFSASAFPSQMGNRKIIYSLSLSLSLSLAAAENELVFKFGF